MRQRYYNYIYNERQKVIFAYVPKVACSNWKCVMRYLEGHENYLDTKYAHDRETSGLTYLDQVPEREEILQDRRIKKFACIRDPYSRILSAYLNKIVERLPFSGPPETKDVFDLMVENIEQFRTATLDPTEFPEITFEVFLRWLATRYSHYTDDEHWRTQSDLLSLPQAQFDFLGRFETLATDAPAILDQIGCDIEFPSQKQIGFAPTGAQQQLDKYYTVSCRELVQVIYSKDFKRFGYSLGA